jgi:vacuolar-type H+-ATPase subunit F/Vma7
MAKLVFIGDEISAAGWALAGMDVITPPVGSEERTVKEALSNTELLIITTQIAQNITPALLEKILTSTSVLTHVVGNMQNQLPQPDYEAQLRAKLGLGQ